jgi:hypothetical protein
MVQRLGLYITTECSTLLLSYVQVDDVELKKT